MIHCRASGSGARERNSGISVGNSAGTAQSSRTCADVSRLSVSGFGNEAAMRVIRVELDALPRNSGFEEEPPGG